MFMKRLSSKEDMRQAGIPEEEIEMRVSMREGRQSICIFNRNTQHAQIDDFEIVKLIGKGAFGKVYCVQNVKTGKIYAMKTIRKDLVIEQNQISNLSTEKEILHHVQYPFLINMEFVFQNEFRIYFLMQFVKGGMLFDHLASQQKAFPEETAKFFTIQVALAIGHLHSMSIVYRDLKPENVLVGEDGEY